MPGWSPWRTGPATRSVEALLFPTACVACDGEDGPICEGCREELTEASGLQCPRCALSVGPWTNLDGGCSWCWGRSLGFDAAVALGPYQGPIREICLRMKRDREAWLARWATELLMESRGGDLRGFGADLAVAVPLHWRRRLGRGYNQAEALAGHLAARLDIPTACPIRRVVATPKLAECGREERAELLKKAFRAARGVRLEGRTVLLVDDILTTGSTCGAAARSLKAAGARKVVAVVVGRAEGRT